jgi:hypothetical protein
LTSCPRQEKEQPSPGASPAQARTASGSGGGGGGRQTMGPEPGIWWQIPSCGVPSTATEHAVPTTAPEQAAIAGCVAGRAGRQASGERIPMARQRPLRVDPASLNVQAWPGS